MADPVATEVTAAAAPIVEGAPAIPVAVEAAPVAPAAPAATEAPPTPAADAAPKSTPSLISEAQGKPQADAKASDAKPATDTPAPADAAKPDAKTAETKVETAKPDDPGKTKDEGKSATDPAKEATALAPPALVTLEDLKLPEGVKLADEPSKAFLEALNKADLAPKDRANTLLELHTAEINRVAQEIAQQQRDAWTQFNDVEKARLRSDPELGGNRLNTNLQTAKFVIEENLSPASQAKLMAFLDYSGAGNQREIVELLVNIGKRYNIVEDGMVTANAKPPKMPKGPGNRGWYDKSQANGAAP